MLAIEKLSVSYGSVRALTDVDLEVRGDGVLHGIIGPNGAGKSTLLDAICGRRRPTSGRVRYCGEDITRRSISWCRRQGMARSFQRTSIFQDLTVHEQLRLVAQHLGDDRLDDVIEVMDLGGYLDQKAGRIAYGVQRRPVCRPRRPCACSSMCATSSASAGSRPSWSSTMLTQYLPAAAW
jgi:branched-chain amino acid transport system ATP-binding protein